MLPSDDLFESGLLPNPHKDALLIREHDNPADLIYLSLGDNWTYPAPGLLNALRHIPPHAHGYTLSPYGLPALRNELRKYIARTHQLPAAGRYDVAVSQAGTRSTMSDYAKLLQTSASPFHTVLIPDPGWDYASLFAPLGFTVSHYHLTAERSWQPDPVEIARQLDKHSLLVLNPQHNPTGVEWSHEHVSSLIALAIERNAALLIDDAYYALHAPGHRPVNALRCMVEQTSALPTVPPWLAVRSLGKQFGCNGWGLGAMTAPPEVITALADIAHQHTYGTALPLQAAMAQWLADPAAELSLEQTRRRYAENRAMLFRMLTQELGFPVTACIPGHAPPICDIRSPRALSAAMTMNTIGVFASMQGCCLAEPA